MSPAAHWPITKDRFECLTRALFTTSCECLLLKERFSSAMMGMVLE